jgi:hypothetical protein
VGRRHAAALTAAALVAGAGCGPFGDEVEGSLEPLSAAAKRAGRTHASFRLASVTDFDWDRVYVFPPYRSSEEIERELGFDWGGAGDSESTSNDAWYLLVFVNGGQVTRAFDHEIAREDLACIADPFVEGGLSRPEAVLRVIPKPGTASGGGLVWLARPRDEREARRVKRCVRTYS